MRSQNLFDVIGTSLGSMAESVDASDLKSADINSRESSSLSTPINTRS